MLQKIPIEEQDVDILTNNFSRGKSAFHKRRIGVAQNPFLSKREC